jgi:ubiquinone/menaquinone biosynthesis C-methylase UbiE
MSRKLALDLIRGGAGCVTGIRLSRLTPATGLLFRQRRHESRPERLEAEGATLSFANAGRGAMVETDKVFAGSIPELYDRYMVPLIFQPYADDLARRVASLQPKRVLETAAGTGVLTRALRLYLPEHAEIVATDLNQPMLDYARSRQAVQQGIAWQQADALAVPFEDQSFGAVACQFGAMFFPDKVRGFAEARRVLKPGGRFIFNVWDRISENEFADVVTQALAELFPADPPRFMQRTPHGYHDIGIIKNELAAAGFGVTQSDTVTYDSKAPSAEVAAIAYCQGTPLRAEIESRKGASLEEATRYAADALANRFGNGPVQGRIQAHVLSAAKD